MKNIIVAFALLTAGCAHRHMVMTPHVIHEQHEVRQNIVPYVGGVTIGDDVVVKRHTLAVLDLIYARINRHGSQAKGMVFIKMAWFISQGLSDVEKEKVISILNKDGYEWGVGNHYNVWTGQFQEDILITW